MASVAHQPRPFKLSAPVRRNDRSRATVIEDDIQVSIRRAAPLSSMVSKRDMTSPMSDDFLTPKAATHIRAISPNRSESDYSGAEYESSRHAPRGRGNAAGSFDELYDISGSEAEEVPLKLSSSIKHHLAKKAQKGRYPSVVIPSPGQWPTIDKLRSATALSPSFKMQLSPAVLARFQAKQVPSRPSTPSLDGSLTSEELASSSCPSTPDIAALAEGDSWEMPIQLDPSSITLLEQINGGERHGSVETVIEVPEQSEMSEVPASAPLTATMKLDTKHLAPPTATDAEDQLSALSIPSPGGFFASLNSTVARNTWNPPANNLPTSTATEFYGVPFRSSLPDALPTSTAASFYGVPWQTRPDNTIEHVVSVASPAASTADPVTARKVCFSPTDGVTEVDEIDETYDESLKSNAAVNIDRTQLWLSSQTEYMQALCEEDEIIEGFQHIDGAVPSTQTSPIDSIQSPASATVSPSKRSVRFAETPSTTSPASDKKRISPIHDGTFWEGWQHLKRSQRARDVFQHRQARAEADHTKRVSLPAQHARQLSGRYALPTKTTGAPRPDSTIFPTEPEDAHSALITQANREQAALAQMQSSSWALAAQREVNGGRLLTSPVTTTFQPTPASPTLRILDLAGQVRASWAWAVAAEHPTAEITTTVSTDAEAHVAALSADGPANHTVVAAPHLWVLPFPDAHFDVVSARNLYAHLRTVWPRGEGADEWDLTLREVLRVLRPGGYLEFDLLDAELAHAGEGMGQSVGVEFSVNLKTRGYDPVAGKSFLPRLKRAGFRDIKRAWMLLPVADSMRRWDEMGVEQGVKEERWIAADGTVSVYPAAVMGSTRDVRAMTGLVGARMWEQWMLKLTAEMGRSETKCLDQVAKALEEGGKGNAGWRCLVGWARKEMH